MDDRFTIVKVWAREVLDSRGNPTVEAEVWTEGGSVGRAIVPSGASRGRHEAVELRDGGRRFMGMGVSKAVGNVREVIGPRLVGMDVRRQDEIDRMMVELDGTPNKSNLGANAILAVSMAVARAASTELRKPLYAYLAERDRYLMPVPFMNLINGGLHAGNMLDFQEHHVVPLGAESFSEALRMGVEVFKQVGKVLVKRYGRSAVNVGDEGGYSPPMSTLEEPLEVLVEAVEELGYGGSIMLALDVAASHLYDERRGVYRVYGRELSGGELVDLYLDLVSRYPIVSIEDPLHEEDFEGFAELTRRSGIQIVGDDLFTTNPERLRRGIETGSCNAVLLKPNQIGTVSEAIQVAEMALEGGYAVQVSHRSGETEDAFISDLAVALSCGQIKAGAPCRGERTAKYNRLLRIEEELGDRASYPGPSAVKRLS